MPTSETRLTPRQREYLNYLRSRPKYAGNNRLIFWEGVRSFDEYRMARSLARKGLIEIAEAPCWIDVRVRAI
jgi:hypothetical protein